MIAAQYNSLYQKTGIDPKIFESRTEAEIKYLRKTMGNQRYISCGMEFSKGYKEYPKYPMFNFIMSIAYSFNKAGSLPFSGGVAEQPGLIMDALELITMLDQEREADTRKKAKNG
jgi:hypothetical protein